MKEERSSSLSVEGIVAVRDGQPYIKLFKDKSPIAQMSMAQARSFANDILTMCARTEADAMIHQFFAAMNYPSEAAGALMLEFRLFRHRLDTEEVEKSVTTPSGDPPPS